ncbi:hypothetical protein Sgleb_75800 [Streptomyces glebosus]|uniref:Uncharacterized protein n=1 Tax=Streptomyces glebosus TaxID=249580 RepID=A0A640T721_9ACTN|nr:hypothetical protein Sgleb_75800 [Streptomyces glebosus]
MTRRQLTDGQWKFIEPYLPIGRYGPYPERLREQFEGVIWRFAPVPSGGRCLPSSGPGPPSTDASASGGTPVSSLFCWKA